jgi:hypothetical protein
LTPVHYIYWGVSAARALLVRPHQQLIFKVITHQWRLRSVRPFEISCERLLRSCSAEAKPASE